MLKSSRLYSSTYSIGACTENHNCSNSVTLFCLSSDFLQLCDWHFGMQRKLIWNALIQISHTSTENPFSARSKSHRVLECSGVAHRDVGRKMKRLLSHNCELETFQQVHCNLSYLLLSLCLLWIIYIGFSQEDLHIF